MIHVTALAAPFAAAMLAATAPTSAQDDVDAKVAWLRKNTTATLAGLARMIGTAEMVLLGEATHGDGTTFRRKVEICQYLHQKCGFSAIVFESGFYECHHAWREILSGRDPSAAARDAIFAVWSKSAQVESLWRHIGRHSRTERPLELAGFDFQPTGVHTRKTLLDDLRKAIAAHAPNTGRPTLEALEAPLALMRDGKFGALRRLGEDERRSFQTASEEVAAALRRPAPFVAQSARSHASYLRFLWGLAPHTPPDVFNIREEQGAENLLWLRDHVFEGRKIIVWGATSHLSRNRQKIETDNAKNMIPVGHHVARSLGDELFILGFDTHHGVASIGRKGGAAHEIAPAPRGSFADLMHRAGRDGAFLDLRTAAWLREPRIARVMGHVTMRADWSQVLDAICFVEEMRPSQPSRPKPKTGASKRE